MDRSKKIKSQKSKVKNKFRNIFLDFFKRKKTNFGFTLIEVLVSIGLLGTMVITVAYMTIMNQNEILRHNAESYADLIASDQFSSLAAYRNQISFDNDVNTYWGRTILNWANRNQAVYFYKTSSNNLNYTFGTASKSFPISVRGAGSTGGVTLKYSLNFQKMVKPNGDLDDNLLKVHLKVIYQDRGGERIKNYYTVIANYLGSRTQGI